MARAIAADIIRMEQSMRHQLNFSPAKVAAARRDPMRVAHRPADRVGVTRFASARIAAWRGGRRGAYRRGYPVSSRPPGDGDSDAKRRLRKQRPILQPLIAASGTPRRMFRASIAFGIRRRKPLLLQQPLALYAADHRQSLDV